MIKLLKSKDKERFLKAARDKWDITNMGTPISITTHFSPLTMKTRESDTWINNCWSETNVN